MLPHALAELALLTSGRAVVLRAAGPRRGGRARAHREEGYLLAAVTSRALVVLLPQGLAELALLNLRPRGGGAAPGPPPSSRCSTSGRAVVVLPQGLAELVPTGEIGTCWRW